MTNSALVAVILNWDDIGAGLLLWQLDKFNPVIAARQAAALSSFRRYDAGRQALMRAQLQRLLDTAGLSKDTFEIASRSLKD